MGQPQFGWLILKPAFIYGATTVCMIFLKTWVYLWEKTYQTQPQLGIVFPPRIDHCCTTGPPHLPTSEQQRNEIAAARISWSLVANQTAQRFDPQKTPKFGNPQFSKSHMGFKNPGGKQRIHIYSIWYILIDTTGCCVFLKQIGAPKNHAGDNVWNKGDSMTGAN